MFAWIITGICVVVIVLLSIALYYKNEDIELKTKSLIQDVVQQVNYVHQYIYQYEMQQERNIMNLDQNIKAMFSQQQRLFPNANQLCLGGTCITESDLMRLKAML